MRTIIRLTIALASLVVTRCEGDNARIDVSPPDRLDIVMIEDGGQLARCDQIGGELIYYPERSVARFVCEDVDY